MMDGLKQFRDSECEMKCKLDRLNTPLRSHELRCNHFECSNTKHELQSRVGYNKQREL
jgi:hypothetical protein